MCFFNKHKPLTLEDNEFHPKIAQQLIKLTKDDDLPNLLLYGLPGSGKQTLINNLLYHIHGEKILHTKTRDIKIKPNECTTFTISITESNYHIEIDPTQKPKKDRQIIQHLIINYATIRHFNSYEGKSRYQIIVIFNADKLSYDAQTALRVTMEKCTKSCTIILCSSQLNKIIEPIRSRCFLIRLPLPTPTIIKQTIQKILDKENMESKNLDDVIKQNAYSYRKCITIVQCSGIEDTWRSTLQNDVMNVIFNNNKITRTHLNKIRDTLYKILSHNIPERLITKYILEYTLSKFGPASYSDIVELASDVNNNTPNSFKDLIHLEYFIIKIILYKTQHVI